MKTNRLPAWATSVMRRMSDVNRLNEATAANLQGLRYGG
jgi:hypothetical protein